MLEDGPSIILNMKDIESDSLDLGEKVDNAKIEINDNQLTIFPNKDYFGELIISLYQIIKILQI